MCRIVQLNKLKNYNELIKFIAPDKLKRRLQELADERNITLSTLLRLISLQYVKRSKARDNFYCRQIKNTAKSTTVIVPATGSVLF